MKKKILVILGVLVFFTTMLFIVGFYLSPLDKLNKSDVIVVVSGGETGERIKSGAELYREGWAPKMIFSGAAARGTISDAEAMANIAVKQGVNREDIILEEQATNTAENGKYTAQIIAQKEFRSIILVTSPYHMRRASVIFKTYLPDSFPIKRYPSEDSTWSKKAWFITGIGWRRTVEEISGILYFYSYQKNSVGANG